VKRESHGGGREEERLLLECSQACHACPSDEDSVKVKIVHREIITVC
jgi:hypothetical protein